MNYEAVIGLEIHVQLATGSKAFSSSAVQNDAAPNTLIDPTVLGMPGALPTFNAQALELAIRLGLACECRIREHSYFARKHYFYPDSPKGYQITQHEEPICEGGRITLLGEEGLHHVPLTRIHLEEDAGKSSHLARGGSRIDLNRAGVPLCEIVTEPAIRSASEAANTMRAIRQLVRHFEISEGDLEKGQMRCDANVSLRPIGREALGTRTELKNINSFRFVEEAINSEIARQNALLSQGRDVVRETRLWDADRGVSKSMRTKEDVEDYRYFRDPDLPVLYVSDAHRESVRAAMGERPSDAYARYTSDWGIAHDQTLLLLSDRSLAIFADDVVSALGLPHAAVVVHWIQGELLALLKKDQIDIEACPISAERFAGLINLIVTASISRGAGKKVLGMMWTSRESARSIAEKENLAQCSDPEVIGTWVDEVLKANSEQVEAFRGGQTSLRGFFVGKVMKLSGKRANPAVVTQVLLTKLDT